MEEAKEQDVVEDLMAENRAILEELAQCKADKDFVWNLWRRLQSSQPEVTSVVSMVVAREKEKSEQKDKKVLEILQMKDEKIKDLKEKVLSAEDESHYSKTRYHDLLIENEELKQRLGEKQTEFSVAEKELRDENSYLSSLLKAHQAQKEVDDQTVKENLDRIAEEKNQLKIRIVSLEREVGDFSEEKLNMASAVKVNATLEDRIKSLENEVKDLSLKSAEIAKNYDETELKLNDKENQVKEQVESMREQSEKIAELESTLMFGARMIRMHWRSRDQTLRCFTFWCSWAKCPDVFESCGPLSPFNGRCLYISPTFLAALTDDQTCLRDGRCVRNLVHES